MSKGQEWDTHLPSYSSKLRLHFPSYTTPKGVSFTQLLKELPIMATWWAGTLRHV